MTPNDVMDRIGKPVSNLNKQEGYKLLKELGVKDSADRFFCVDRVAGHLERDEPFLAMKVAEDYVDATAAYRLFSTLLVPLTVKREMHESQGKEQGGDKEVEQKV